jgi:hypothetical protein
MAPRPAPTTLPPEHTAIAPTKESSMKVHLSSFKVVCAHDRARILIMSAVSVAILGATAALGLGSAAGGDASGGHQGVAAAHSAAAMGVGHRPDVDEAVEGPWSHEIMAGSAIDARESTLFLVSSRDGADRLQRPLEERSAIAVVDSEAMEWRLMQAAGGADAVNAALGLPPLRVIDLRRP